MQIAESGFLHGQAEDITLLDAQHHTTQVYVNVFLLWNNCSVTVFIFCSCTPSSSSASPDVCCELKWLSGQTINGFYIFWFSFCDNEYQTQRIRNQFETIWHEIHFSQQLVHEKPRVSFGVIWHNISRVSYVLLMPWWPLRTKITEIYTISHEGFGISVINVIIIIIDWCIFLWIKH